MARHERRKDHEGQTINQNNLPNFVSFVLLQSKVARCAQTLGRLPTEGTENTELGERVIDLSKNFRIPLSFLCFGETAKPTRGTRALPLQILAEALREHRRTHDIVRAHETGFGMRYIVEGELNTPLGRRPGVRTVWQFDEGTIAPRLITAYPLENS